MVIRDIPDLKSLAITGNLLDVDDMSYSGNQTINVFRGVERRLLPQLVEQIGGPILSPKEIKDFHKLFPRSLAE